MSLLLVHNPKTMKPFFSELMNLDDLQRFLPIFQSTEGRTISRAFIFNDQKTILKSAQINSFQKEFLISHMKTRPLDLIKVESSDDGTYKFLFKLQDDLKIETVFIPFFKHPTICLSSQVGCSMNCDFCYTGKMGFKRSLTSYEILSQYCEVVSWMKKEKSLDSIPSIVFMGQGEPLIPFEEVKKSIQWMLHPNGLNLSSRQITVSTVGYLPHLSKFPELGGVNLALSLHSPFDQERSSIIPVNAKWPLKEILQVIDQLPLKKRQYIIFEYLLIKDFNMSDLHIKELTSIIKPRKAILNLIPFNPFPGSQFKRASEIEMINFKTKLVAKKIPVMMRTTKGLDILAACGQLHTKEPA
jgi:23S rRNA (adenine2503-C2)-methyltransferase